MRARAPPVNGRKRPLTKHKEKGRMANGPRASRGGIPHSRVLNRIRVYNSIRFENCILELHSGRTNYHFSFFLAGVSYMIDTRSIWAKMKGNDLVTALDLPGLPCYSAA